MAADADGRSRAEGGEPDRAELVADFAAAVGHRFADASLLELALSHRSWVSESAAGESNERLEFLGDAVLGFAVAEIAYEMFPEVPESTLNDIRKVVVNERALADLARGIGLGRFLFLGRGEDKAGGRDKSSILADALEAVIGAVFLDAGTDAARAFVGRHFTGSIGAATRNTAFTDHKSALQELLARDGRRPPRYEVSGTGPDHYRVFTARVWVDEAVAGEGTGSTKREAEQDAARAALVGLGRH